MNPWMTPKASSFSDSLTVPVLFCGASRQASDQRAAGGETGGRGAHTHAVSSTGHVCARATEGNPNPTPNPNQALSSAYQQVITLFTRAGVGEGIFWVVVNHVRPVVLPVDYGL